jgi:glycosyltransferase involved in cell wall biosynthesis
MRIVYITRSAFGVLGGADSYLLPSYAQQFFDVIVLSPHSPKTREKIVFLNPRIKVINTYSSNINELVTNTCIEIDRFKPDIIHIFHNFYLLNYAVALNALFPDIKIVIDFRSPPIVSQWRKLVRLQYSYFLAHFYANHVFTHSLRTLGQNLPIRFSKATEIPLGVELDKFNRIDTIHKTENLTRFIYTGSLSRTRQIDTLVEAFIAIVNKSSLPITLDLFGDGDALEYLRKIVNKHDLSERIRLKGAISQNEIYKILCNYDAGIAYVPNELYSAAPSLKSLEFAAAGLPVFASNTLGHRDYCRRFGFNFILFNNSIDDIVDKILTMHDSDEIKKRVEINSQMIKAFDWKNITKDKLLPAYQNIIKN